MHPDQTSTSDASADAGAYASFLITGDAVSPEFWTKYFQVSPDTTIVKGKSFTLPSGKSSKAVGTTGLWGVSSELSVQSDLLEPHFRYLIARLGLPREGLPDLVRRNGAKIRFSCFWFNPSGNRVPDVPDDIRAMMEAMGGTIEIDEYR
ncbi:hypothetical protein CI15_09970 [Paraburkholderia monticola]|uniref:DUF4279 domain-containing protein n=1 Tax=Paraburkholderia monticola TaxID=1399968 RepID=A0A149PW90_9BURK|nr:DUF4279 domain-containing protein [Paraburkholderia monticola]KXU89341.1 hypothetical protein CI15_09970 [Paraburkholderia monticola]